MELPEYHELVLILETFDPSRPTVREVVDPELPDLATWESRKLTMLNYGTAEGVAHYLIADMGDHLTLVDAYGDCNFNANQHVAAMVLTKHRKLEDAINNRKALRLREAAPEFAQNPVSSEERSSEY